MGDDVHMRTQATTNLLIRNLLPATRRGRPDPSRRGVGPVPVRQPPVLPQPRHGGGEVAHRCGPNRCEGSSIVTTMARNGTTFGIRLAGTATWFIADAPPVGDALYYPGYGPDSGAPRHRRQRGAGADRAGRRGRRRLAGGGGLPRRDDGRRGGGHREHGPHLRRPSSRFKLPTLDLRGYPARGRRAPVVELGSPRR